MLEIQQTISEEQLAKIANAPVKMTPEISELSVGSKVIALATHQIEKVISNDGERIETDFGRRIDINHTRIIALILE